MDLFLGRRFFNLGSNIFNYAILRAALNEVDPITLIRRITYDYVGFILYFSWLGVPTSRHVFNGRLWLDCLRFQDLRIVHLAGEHCEREDLLDPLVRLPGAHFRRLVAADQAGISWKWEARYELKRKGKKMIIKLKRQAALLFISLRIFLTPSLTSSLTSPRQVRVLH